MTVSLRPSRTAMLLTALFIPSDTRFEAMLAGIDGAWNADERRRHLDAVHRDGHRLGAPALNDDAHDGHPRLDRFELFFGIRVGCADRLRGARGQFFVRDLDVRLARFDERSEFFVRAPHVEQVHRRMHQRLGACEQIDRIGPAFLGEGLRALASLLRRAPDRCSSVCANARWLTARDPMSARAREGARKTKLEPAKAHERGE